MRLDYFHSWWRAHLWAHDGYCESPPPTGGINSGMPNAPDYFHSWWYAHSWAHGGCFKNPIAVRRSEFRDTKCARRTFMGRWCIRWPGAGKFTLKPHRYRRSKFRDSKCTGLTFILGSALTCGAHEGFINCRHIFPDFYTYDCST